MIIPREFFERDTLEVAKSLLGQVLWRETEEGVTSGIIVETEAYLGELDAAAHSYKGLRDRVRVQYGPSGHAYVYLIYGMYCCMNVTSGPPGVPEVVLIRALKPLDGVELMKKRRKTHKLRNLCSGPGKLCMALDIDRSLYGADLCGDSGFCFKYGAPPPEIEATKRINIDYAGDDKDNLWRFTVKGSQFLSK